MMRKTLPLLPLFALIMFLLVVRIALAAVLKCTISGTVLNADGTPDANDTITITPYPSTQTVQSTIITAAPISVQTDANGNVTAFSLVQGLNVYVTFHNATAAPIATFVPSSATATFSQFLSATSTPATPAPTPTPACVTNTVSTATFTLNTATGTCQVLTLTTNSTITVSGLVGGTPVTVYTVQDTNGGWTPIFVAPGGNTLFWQGANVSSVQPIMPTTLANTVSQWTFVLNGSAIYGTLVGLSTTLMGTTIGNQFSIIDTSFLRLFQLAPPSSVSVTATCTGTCATTYTYKVTCLNDVGQETTPSLAVTATNAATLTSSNFNVVNWAAETGCFDGYNVYGHTAGALVLLATVTSGTSFTDIGAAAPPERYTFTWTSGAAPAVAVWDLRGVSLTTSNPIDVATYNAGTGTTLAASGLTTSANHDLSIPVFAFGSGGGTFTPPGGFSSAVNVGAVPSITRGIWGGTLDIAAAGTTANQTGTSVSSSTWATIGLAVTSSNPATPVTVVQTLSATAAAPYTSVTFGDPVGTAAGDVEIVCVSWSAGSNVTAPSSFNLIGRTGVGGPQSTVLSCYWNLPQGASPAPPTVNTTGIIQQSTAAGTFEETLLGIQSWTANDGNVPNAAASALASTSFPMSLTVVSCRATWIGFSACSPFPVYAIKDTTANVILCSSGTVTNVSADAAVTPTNPAAAANHVIAFLPTTAGVSCAGGLASMSAIFKE